MQNENLDLKYCFNYVSTMNAEGYMITGPAKRMNLEKGSLIAWLDLRNQRAFVVAYIRPRTYRTIGELDFSVSDWTYLRHLGIGHITTLEDGCTVGNLIDVLSGRFSYHKFIDEDDNQYKIDSYYSAA